MSRRTRLAALLAGGLRFGGFTPSWLARQLALAGVLSVAVTLMVELVLLPGGRYISYGQLWLLVTAAFLAQWLGRTLQVGPSPGEVVAGAPEGTEPRARPYPGVERWQQRLSLTSDDPEWFGRVARDRLAGLVAERQRQRHGTGTLDRGVLGDELYEFLTAPLTRTPTPAELSRLITRMEQI